MSGINTIDVLRHIKTMTDETELRTVGKLVWDRIRDLSEQVDSEMALKLAVAKPGSVLKVTWRGKEPLIDVIFESVNPKTVAGLVVHLGKSYRFPAGWVKEVLPPDEKVKERAELMAKFRPSRRRDREVG